MGNHTYKKERAKHFNEIRTNEKKEAEALRLDKINNPEKYAKTRSQKRAERKAQAFIAVAAGLCAY